MKNMNVKLIAISVGVIAVAGVLISTGLATVQTIDSGTVGIKTNFGQVEQKAIEPGIQFLIPGMQSLIKISTKMKAFKTEAHAASHDLQQVTTSVTLQHGINPSMVVKAFVAIGDLSTIDTVVITPAILETVKSVTSHYTAEELITKRDQVKEQIKEQLSQFINNTMSSKGLKGAIEISGMAITDFSFSQDFNVAIENKVKAEQLALQAENEKRQRITQAQAAKAEKELSADAEAYTTKIQSDAVAYKATVESKAHAAAIEREANALKSNPGLVQYRAVEKWDGALPTTMVNGKGGTVPFINIDATTRAQSAPAGQETSEEQAK